MALVDAVRQAVNAMYRDGYRFVFAREVAKELDRRNAVSDVGGALDGLIPENDRVVTEWQFVDGEPTSLTAYRLTAELPEPRRARPSIRQRARRSEPR